MTATRGLNFSEMSFAVKGAVAARLGKSERSSRSLNPALTKDGSGTKDKTSTADTEVSKPLAIKRVLRQAIQPWRVRGGSDRMATRRMMETRHRSGSTRIKGMSESFAHHGTAGGSLGSILAGCSGATLVSAISPGLITIFSMKREG